MQTNPPMQLEFTARFEHISLGRASQITGIHIMDFQKLLATRGICIHYDVEEYQQDIQHLQDKGWL